MKQQFRILLADRDATFCHMVASALSQRGFAVCSCVDGAALLRLTDEFVPDLIILDLLLPEADGLTVLRSLHERSCMPKVLVVTAFVSDYTAAWLAEHGVGHIMLKPCLTGALAERAAELLSHTEAADCSDQQYLHDLLAALRLNPMHCGSRYLLDAVCQARLNAGCALRVTKEIYPAIAARHHTTASRVERSIRFALHAAWQISDEKRWEICRALGVDPGLCPSNGKMISALVTAMQTAKKNRIG